MSQPDVQTLERHLNYAEDSNEVDYVLLKDYEKENKFTEDIK